MKKSPGQRVAHRMEARDPVVRDRLITSMKAIGAQPRGFFTGGGRLNLPTGAFDIETSDEVGVSHLSAAFGPPETCAELGTELRGTILRRGHVRLSAFAEWRDAQLAQRAWAEFLGERAVGTGGNRLPGIRGRSGAVTR